MLFSIITINYNNKSGLKKTIESVVHQTFSNIEYIVIDGGSNDGSKEVIEQYKEYFSYWVSEQDNGIYHAMNKGISRVSGDFILFLNSGDTLYSKDVVEKFDDIEEKGDVSYGNIYFDYGTKKQIWDSPDELRLAILYYGSLPHPGTFFKKKIFETYGNYDESFKIVADWAYFFKLFLETNITFKKIDLVISNFPKDGISSSEDSVKIIQEERSRFIDENISLGLKKSIIGLLEKEKEFSKLSKKYDRLSSNVFVKLIFIFDRIKYKLRRVIGLNIV